MTEPHNPFEDDGPNATQAILSDFLSELQSTKQTSRSNITREEDSRKHTTECTCKRCLRSRWG